MGYLLFFLGLLIISFLHLIIPICFAAGRKQRKKSTLWLLALAGGLFGFVICFIMQEEFRGLAGILQSAFWTVIAYFILKKRCYQKENFCQKSTTEEVKETASDSTPTATQQDPHRLTPITTATDTPKVTEVCLSWADEEPKVYGTYHVSGRDILLSKEPDEPNDIFGCDMLKKEPPRGSADCSPEEQTPEIRFCRKCGSRLMEGARFCSQCGTAVITMTSEKKSVVLESSPLLTPSVQVDVTNHTSNNVKSTHSVVPAEPQVNKETVETTALRKCIESALKYTTDEGCYRDMKFRYTSLPTTEKQKIEPLFSLPAKQFRMEIEKILSSLD
jgi:hypothetical protein